MVDTPRHVHEREDELFVSLEGDHVIELDGQEHRIAPGESVFAPRGVPHAQRRVVAGEGRLLVVTTPGGLDGFFRELAAADTAGTLGPEAYATASERYGITWLWRLSRNGFSESRTIRCAMSSRRRSGLTF